MGQGQFGVVYDLSPNYAIKKVSIMQGGRDKKRDIEGKIFIAVIETLELKIMSA